MSQRTLLVYGYGANVGSGIVKKFSESGWKTAAIVRTMKDEYLQSADLVLQVDFADGEAIKKVYSEVEQKLGTPNCVVYNAYAHQSFAPDITKPFSASSAQFTNDLAVNTVGCFAAASSSDEGFKRLPADAPKVFIYTGNGFPTSIVPEQPGLGAGKAASAYLIEAAANALGTESQWYFADERLDNGKPIMTDLSGEAHGEAYYEIATRKEQGPWNYTFVKGKGYKKFGDTHVNAYTPIAKLFAEIGK